jgi:hypothetical protein
MVFVEIHTNVLKLWKAIFHHFFCGQQFEQDHNSLQMDDHFTLHRDHLFAHFLKFYTTVLQFLHPLHSGHKPCIIHNGFPQQTFSMRRKQITVQLLQLVWLIIAGHIITQSVETRMNTRWPVIWWFSARRTKDLLKLNRDQLRWVLGLFTGHCHLKGHLFKLELRDDPICKRCLGKGESAKHILCDCEAIAYLRFCHLVNFSWNPGTTMMAP